MTEFERQIQEHGILATYSYLKILYAYYVLFDKPDSSYKTKLRLKSLATSTNIAHSDIENLVSLSKEDLEIKIFNFAKQLDFYDEMFEILKQVNDINLTTLVMQQRIVAPYSVTGLTPKVHHYAIATHRLEYLKLNGFSVFIYLVRFNEIKPNDALRLFGKLLLQSYLLVEELEFEDSVVYLKLYANIDIATEQIYIYPRFGNELRDHLIFLPMDVNLKPFHVSYLKGVQSSKDFMETVENVLVLTLYREDSTSILKWLVSTQAWTPKPSIYYLNISRDLSPMGIKPYDIKYTLPSDKGFSNYLPLLADNCSEADRAPNILVRYLAENAGDGITLAIKLEMYQEDRTSVLLCYLEHMIKYMGHLAEVYKIQEEGCTYKELLYNIDKKCINIFNKETKQFKSIPTVNQLIDILLYFKHCTDEDLLNYFDLLNAVYKCFMFNKAYWWELTKPLTGFSSYYIHAVSANGTFLVEFTMKTGETFKVTFHEIANKILYEVDYYIYDASETISPETFNLMFNGKIYRTEGPVEQSVYDNGYTFDFNKLVIDAERFCVYPFRDINCLETSVCYLPYEIALADDNTIKIADKFFKVDHYASHYEVIDKETDTQQLLQVIDFSKSTVEKPRTTKLFEEVYADENGNSSFR